MNCASCGTQLPPGAAACPNCGAATPAYFSGTNSSAYEPTVAASYTYNTPQAAPSTSYGSQTYDPYSVPQQNPYAIPQPLPLPPPPPSRRGNNIGLMIGIGVLILALVGGGIFALLAYQHAGTPATPTPAGPTTAQSNATATANAAATATATAASQNPYPPFGGTLVFNDPLHDNSKGFKWDEGTFADGSTCGFVDGSYHVGKSQQGFFGCNAEAQVKDESNFVFEVQTTVLQGTNGGIFFRAPADSSGYYYFAVFTTGPYAGRYGLYTDTKSGYKLLTGTGSEYIKTGQNVSNTLAVVANGNSIDLYANLHHLGSSVNDNTFSDGSFGVVATDAYVTSDESSPSVVAYSNARLWTL